tara:strand:+ start:144 stop:326 length:183 start_codon:yes stop_codon:yes gene_type:complete
MFVERIHMKLSFNEVMLRLVTAINMETGDDGTKAKKIIDRLFVLLKMDKKEYKKQVKYYG